MTRSNNAEPELTLRARRQLRRAEAWVARGEYLAAERALQTALDEMPGHPDVLVAVAMARYAQGHFGDAERLLRRALHIRPGDAAILNKLGSTLGEVGAVEQAVTVLRDATQTSPRHVPYWMNLAFMQRKSGDFVAARESLERVLQLDPSHRFAALRRADILGTLGYLQEAVVALRALLARNRNDAEAWMHLVSLKIDKLDDGDLATIQALHDKMDVQHPQRIALGFALGQALEEAGRREQAFKVLVAANAEQRARLSWDADAFSRSLADQREARLAEPLTQATNPSLGRDVLFIVGMPRSGSTLLEQILFAHPDVDSAGEIGVVQQVLLDECNKRGGDVPQWAGQATPAEWQRLGENYLEQVACYRGSGRLLTDKGLEKWRLIDVVHAMLPGARIIDCRREPLQTCWSCFKHLFKEGHEFSYDLLEVAQMHVDYQRSMEFWDTCYPGLIYRHDHDMLLKDAEAQIRALLAAFGLDFNSDCLRPHVVQRSVQTLSAGQVRQPLNPCWGHVADTYGADLDPLREALAGTTHSDSG